MSDAVQPGCIGGLALSIPRERDTSPRGGPAYFSSGSPLTYFPYQARYRS